MSDANERPADPLQEAADAKDKMTTEELRRIASKVSRNCDVLLDGPVVGQFNGAGATLEWVDTGSESGPPPTTESGLQDRILLLETKLALLWDLLPKVKDKEAS